MVDEMAQKGLEIDTRALGERLGIEVLETVATKGQQVDRIVPLAISAARPPDLEIPYNPQIEAAVRSLRKTVGAGRRQSLAALQGIGTDEELLDLAGTVAERIEEENRMTISQIIAANRHNAARSIAGETVSARPVKAQFDLDTILTSTFPGIPILICLLLSMLGVVFVVGAYLEEIIVELFEVYAVEPLLALGLPPLAETVAHSVVIALQAGLGIAFPFVFVFYILLSIVEDTGYMTRAAFLADNAMHRIGMHGGGIIPLVLAFGCNVPAVMGLKSLKSRRERIIGSFLITMVPCSARTVIILGIVAAFVGIAEAFSIYLIVLLLIIVTGLFLSRFTPGERFGMILEMAPLRRPEAGPVIRKSWMRMGEFFFIAMPMLLVGSVFLGLFEYYGIIEAFQATFGTVAEQLLGIPPYAVTALLFGILRKEMAFETLAILAGTADLGSVMTSLQLYIFALVSVLFVPCISTIAVLLREMGYRITAMVTIYTVGLGIITGALINFFF
jgi:ferrous iron transport protein B